MKNIRQWIRKISLTVLLVCIIFAMYCIDTINKTPKEESKTEVFSIVIPVTKVHDKKEDDTKSISLPFVEQRVLLFDVSEHQQDTFATKELFEDFLSSYSYEIPLGGIIIRIGNRGNTEGLLYEDKAWRQFAQACENLHIPFGFYFLSEAISFEEAEEEISFINSILSQESFVYNKLPLAIDIENYDSDSRTANLWDSNPGRVDFLKHQLSTLEKQRKKVMIYSCMSMIDQYHLTDLGYPVWGAHYGITESFPDKKYHQYNTPYSISDLAIWQYIEQWNDISIDVNITDKETLSELISQ